MFFTRTEMEGPIPIRRFPEASPMERIERAIPVPRGQRVMLDADLSADRSGWPDTEQR